MSVSGVNFKYLRFLVRELMFKCLVLKFNIFVLDRRYKYSEIVLLC